jgi:hypothetical protein
MCSHVVPTARTRMTSFMEWFLRRTIALNLQGSRTMLALASFVAGISLWYETCITSLEQLLRHSLPDSGVH